MAGSLPKPDSPGMRLIQILGILSWVLLFGSVFFYFLAQPEQETFLDRRWNKTVRTSVDSGQIDLSLKLLQANLILCGGGFLINLLHKVTTGKHFNRSLIGVGVLSVLALIGFHQYVV